MATCKLHVQSHCHHWAPASSGTAGLGSPSFNQNHKQTAPHASGKAENTQTHETIQTHESAGEEETLPGICSRDATGRTAPLQSHEGAG